MSNCKWLQIRDARPLYIPQVNLNGTNASALHDEACIAYNAIQGAVVQLSRMTVHGRDFQTLPADESSRAYEGCRSQLNGWMQKLKDVQEELVSYSAAIMEQDGA